MKIEELEIIEENSKLEYQWKLLEIRYDYGWKYFDFHAKQRMMMFNFFILFAGILANSYFFLVKESLFETSIGVSILGLGVTFAFIFLDRRNEELVHMAEDVLASLEKDILFKNYERVIDWPKRRNWLGQMTTLRKVNRQVGIFLREEIDGDDIGKSRYSHGKWLARIQIGIAFFFVFCGIYAVYNIACA